MKKLVIIGNGMAGARVASDILARGGAARFQITIFGDEPGGNYNRIMLSDVLNGSKAADSIVLHPLEWYEQQQIRLFAGERVTHIDREKRIVCGDGGSVEAFDVLIIATGSRAFIPPIAGLETPDGARKPGIFVMRTLADCARIAGFAAKAPRAIVVGGGLLGLEAARGLMQHGARVHLVNRSAGLMSQQLDATGGELLRDQIEKMGISVHLDKASTRILGEQSVEGLEFKDGETLPADMIVFACGIAPNVELARESGLRVERAIAVDDQMRCAGETAIYAVGECAQHRGEVYGLVAPIWEQSRVLADVLTGKKPDAAYLGSKTSTKLKVMGVELASMGVTNEIEGDEVIEYLEKKRPRYKKLVIRDGKLVGAILLGDLAGAASLMQVFERGMALPEDRAGLLFKIGKTRDDVSALPDEAAVCNCNGVSAGAIRGCIGNGAADVNAIMRETRAGTGCRSCKGLLGAFLKAKTVAT